MKPAKFLINVWKLQAQPDCYFFIATKAVKGGRWKDHPFKSPVKYLEVNSLLKKYSDHRYHLYFCPLPFRENRRSRSLALGSRLLWADLDESNPRKIDPIPQIAWRSSPGRYSALWILNKFHTTMEIEPVNKGMSYLSGADKAGWDLTQVLRIPGTRNLKYDDKPKGKLLWFKDNQYSIDRIPEYTPSLNHKEVIKKYRSRIKGGTLKLLKSTVATEGKRSHVIWKLNNELQEQGLNKDEVFTLIKNCVWNKFAGRSDEDRQLKREIEKVSSRLRKQKREIKKTKKILTNSDDQFILRMSNVKPEAIEWLWWPYIPIGKVTIIEGDPGVGKSYMTLAIASALTNRHRLPEQQRALTGKVLLLSGEDGPNDTIRPRLDQVGADLKKIYLVNQPILLDEEGIEEIEIQIKEIRPKLVIVDPLNTYLAGVDTHHAVETREAMHRILKLAERQHVAILAVRHFTKASKDKVLYRGQGSIELAAVARSIIQVGRDPTDDDGRAMCQIKNNLGPLGCTIGFSLTFPTDHPFKWTGKSDLTAKEVMDAQSEGIGRSSREEIVKFFDEHLKKKPCLKDEILLAAEGLSIAKSKLMRIRRELHIKQIRKKGKHYWIRT